MLRHLPGFGLIPIGPHLAQSERFVPSPPQMGTCAHCHQPLELYGVGTVWTTECSGQTGKCRPRHWHTLCRAAFVAELTAKEAVPVHV
jgi:hypothetical protein